MKAFKALLMREYWEHRGAFLKTPIIIGIITAVMMILAYLLVENVNVKLTGGEGLEHLKQITDRTNTDITYITNIFLTGLEGLFHFVLFIVVFFFLLGSLFDDRKDLSILFWKSLPVSDLNTVLSKVVAAMVVAPLCFWVILMASELVCMILFSFFLLINGANPFTLLWANTELLSHWAAFGMGCFIQAIWALPVYGWLLLCSAWAKRRPFIWAVGVPAMVFMVRGWMAAFTFSGQAFMNLKDILMSLSTVVLNALAPYESRSDLLQSIRLGGGNNGPVDPSGIMSSMYQNLFSGKVIYGFVFAAVCISLAIFIRRYRNTT